MRLTLPEASSNAAEVDHLLLALVLIALAVLALVFGLIWIYVIRYRAGSPINRGEIADKTWRIEVAWTAATLLAFFGLFIWGADLYVRLFTPPGDALKVYVVGKQWMWKVEYSGGQKEIDSLHVPVGQPVELVMTSEDVIHDFSVPAFRVKHDVLPGRYETLWFTATRRGRYHLFCTQLCGTGHADMIGWVTAMNPRDYQAWLSQNGASESLAAAGQTLFMRYGCSGCHGGNGIGGQRAGAAVRAPPLAGLYGSKVPLSDGSVVTADDLYIRDSVLEPDKQVVAGYQPVMPSFAGQITEDDLLRIVAYIKSLSAEGRL